MYKKQSYEEEEEAERAQWTECDTKLIYSIFKPDYTISVKGIDKKRFKGERHIFLSVRYLQI